VLSVVARKLQCFISSGSIAPAPYINQNGVKFVAQQTVVLWLHTAIGMTSAHFVSSLPPIFSSLPGRSNRLLSRLLHSTAGDTLMRRQPLCQFANKIL
jgi:hypothetical protein